jgi:hypothetical protein
MASLALCTTAASNASLCRSAATACSSAEVRGAHLDAVLEVPVQAYERDFHLLALPGDLLEALDHLVDMLGEGADLVLLLDRHAADGGEVTALGDGGDDGVHATDGVRKGGCEPRGAERRPDAHTDEAHEEGDVEAVGIGLGLHVQVGVVGDARDPTRRRDADAEGHGDEALPHREAGSPERDATLVGERGDLGGHIAQVPAGESERHHDGPQRDGADHEAGEHHGAEVQGHGAGERSDEEERGQSEHRDPMCHPDRREAQRRAVGGFAGVTCQLVGDGAGGAGGEPTVHGAQEARRQHDPRDGRGDVQRHEEPCHDELLARVQSPEAGHQRKREDRLEQQVEREEDGQQAAGESLHPRMFGSVAAPLKRFSSEGPLPARDRPG